MASNEINIANLSADQIRKIFNKFKENNSTEEPQNKKIKIVIPSTACASNAKSVMTR